MTCGGTWENSFWKIFRPHPRRVEKGPKRESLFNKVRQLPTTPRILMAATKAVPTGPPLTPEHHPLMNDEWETKQLSMSDAKFLLNLLEGQVRAVLDNSLESAEPEKGMEVCKTRGNYTVTCLISMLVLTFWMQDLDAVINASDEDRIQPSPASAPSCPGSWASEVDVKMAASSASEFEATRQIPMPPPSPSSTRK